MDTLIHIGYHKTGTSWLQTHLFNNIRVGFVSPFARDAEIGGRLIYPNSLDFSPQDCRDWFYPRILAAINDKLTPVLSYERLSGNPHSGGYDSKEIADRLKQVFPHASILVVIREQKAMILSTYKQYVYEGGACTVKGYLQPPSRGKGRIPLFSFDYFKYHRLIRYYIELFGKPNVLALPYELFRDKPHEFASAIINFSRGMLEHESLKELDHLALAKRENIAFSGFTTRIKRIINPIFALDHVNPWAILPSPAVERQLEWWLRRLDSRLLPSLRKSSDKKLKEDIAGMIGERYRLSNRRTAAMTGIELGEYGYDL